MCRWCGGKNWPESWLQLRGENIKSNKYTKKIFLATHIHVEKERRQGTDQVVGNLQRERAKESESPKSEKEPEITRLRVSSLAVSKTGVEGELKKRKANRK